MDEAKYKDWILETIDQLRKRKARPDLERICHMVERKHGPSFDEIVADLEKLVDAGIVYKVDYKGNTSYRNAAKWKKIPLGCHVVNSAEVSSRILDAVRTLTEPLGNAPEQEDASDVGRSARQQTGVSFSEIENWMEEEEPDMNLVESTLESALEREVEVGCLKKLSNGNFVFVSEEPMLAAAAHAAKVKTPQKTPSKQKVSSKVRERDAALKFDATAADAAATADAAGGGGGGDDAEGINRSLAAFVHSAKTTSPGKRGRTSTKRKKLKRSLDPDFAIGPETGHKLSRKESSSSEGHRHHSRKDSGSDAQRHHSRKNSISSDGHRHHSRKDSGSDRHRHHSRKDSSDGHRHHSRKDSSEGHRHHSRKDSGAEGKARAERKASSPPLLPPAVAMPSAIMDDNPRCDFCLSTAEQNRNGEREELLFCRECQAKGHPSCMEYSEDLARRARNSPWQCIDCKTCYICEDAGDPDAMLFCDACDKGYHMTCHKPPIDDKPTGKWVCSKCIEELGLEPEDVEMKVEDEDETEEEERDDINEEDDEETEEDEKEETESNVSKQQIKREEYNTDGGPSCLPTPNASPVHFKVEPPEPTESKPKLGHYIHAPLPKLADTMTAEVPDASDWTIEDTVAFFKGVGFIEQCEVFREQEIDGKSLLLMKRSDVLQGLSLRLGPALKIYAHVQRLQTKGQILL